MLIGYTDISKMGSRALFLHYARWAFGFWLFFVGLSKWAHGYWNFADYMIFSFADTGIPLGLLAIATWFVLIFEPLLGALLMVGWQPRIVWLFTSFLMFMLTFGQTAAMEWGTVANNWQYFVFALACSALSEPDSE